ncbi:MAG: insulinase family protein, partial [bacterium]|nr:insulinase family protein [Candidatus Kapabacteria bacterium]
MMLRPLNKGRVVAVGLSLATALTVSVSAADLPTITYDKFVLPNGLTVILSVDKTAPVVATFVHYHVGSKNERPDRTGFAHFFEHLMFEGSKNIQRHSLDKLVQTAGGWLNAFTSFDETGYQIKLPSNQLKLALWIESERMLHAQVEEIGVETQRGVVKEERNVRYDNTPYGSIMENMAKYVGNGTPYAWTPIGSTQYIDQAKIEEFREFYKQYYLPNNAVLAVVGDFDPASTRRLIEDYFSAIPRGPEVARPKFTMALGTAEQSVEIREEKTPLPALIYAYRSVGKAHADSYALEMLATILATGNSSRMYRQMVDEKRLAVGVQAFPLTLESGGIVGLFAVSHATVTMDQVGREFDKLIADVQADGVTQEEFQKARN